MSVKKTSSDWNKEKNHQIISYIGWHLPGKGFHFSWYEELITEHQFDMRVDRSIVVRGDRVINPHGTK